MVWRLPQLAAGLLLAAPALGAWSSFEREVIEHHSLSPPYIQDWWQGGLRYWDFGGDTVVTDKYIRLTPAKQDRDGWLWNEVPNNMPQWELQVGFRLFGKGSADGIALWYVDHPFRSTGHLWGSPEKFRGLGVIMDTYDNDGQRDNPSVTVILNDGTRASWDQDHDLINDGLFRCVYDFRNVGQNEMAVIRLEYKGKRLTAWMSRRTMGHDGSSKGEEMHCGSADNVGLPTEWFFGASATTGHMADYQDIIFFHATPAEGTHVEYANEPIQDHKVHDPLDDRGEREYWRKKSPAERAAEEAALREKQQQEEEEVRMKRQQLAEAELEKEHKATDHDLDKVRAGAHAAHGSPHSAAVPAGADHGKTAGAHHQQEHPHMRPGDVHMVPANEHRDPHHQGHLLPPGATPAHVKAAHIGGAQPPSVPANEHRDYVPAHESVDPKQAGKPHAPEKHSLPAHHGSSAHEGREVPANVHRDYVPAHAEGVKGPESPPTLPVHTGKAHDEARSQPSSLVKDPPAGSKAGEPSGQKAPELSEQEKLQQQQMLQRMQQMQGGMQQQQGGWGQQYQQGQQGMWPQQMPQGQGAQGMQQMPQGQQGMPQMPQGYGGYGMPQYGQQWQGAMPQNMQGMPQYQGGQGYYDPRWQQQMGQQQMGQQGFAGAGQQMPLQQGPTWGRAPPGLQPLYAPGQQGQQQGQQGQQQGQQQPAGGLAQGQGAAGSAQK